MKLSNKRVTLDKFAWGFQVELASAPTFSSMELHANYITKLIFMERALIHQRERLTSVKFIFVLAENR